MGYSNERSTFYADIVIHTVIVIALHGHSDDRARIGYHVWGFFILKIKGQGGTIAYFQRISGMDDPAHSNPLFLAIIVPACI